MDESHARMPLGVISFFLIRAPNQAIVEEKGV
jgi:hypothetical protein